MNDDLDEILVRLKVYRKDGAYCQFDISWIDRAAAELAALREVVHAAWGLVAVFTPVGTWSDDLAKFMADDPYSQDKAIHRLVEALSAYERIVEKKIPRLSDVVKDGQKGR